MCDDIQKCCRICLDADTNHVSIFEDSTITLHLKSCLGLTISSNDHLPKTICVTCSSLLHQFYNFQLNARCSQDWLESSVQQKSKTSEIKMPLQPLPDSEYNSDSLLEFLNNTANIEEYLNNLGKEDIPCIVNMLDKNEQSIEIEKSGKRHISPKKKEIAKKIILDTDVPDSIFKLARKEFEEAVKCMQTKIVNTYICHGCKTNFGSVQKLLQHMSVCDLAGRTCKHCNTLFDSKNQMQQHSITHNTSIPLCCDCGETFQSKEKLSQHHKTCHSDHGTSYGIVYRCKECKDTFTDRFQLFNHAKAHVMNLERQVCDICSHAFVGREALMKHKTEKHNDAGNAIYRCRICNITMSDRMKMYLHVKGHTIVPDPPRHLCESCGRSFATHASLTRHKLTHNNNTKCSICKKMFKDEKKLDEHMLEHCKYVVCEKCGVRINSRDLDDHSCEA